jgi:nitroreductase
MDIYEIIKTRKSVRSYKPDEVEPEKLKRVLEAVRLAPSASNRQEWRFVVARNPDTRKQLARAASGQAFVAEAPVVLACCADSDGHIMRCGHPSFLIDVAIAADHLTLAAAAEGLGTCWIGAFDQQAVKKILDIPEHIQVVQLMPLGYPTNPTQIYKNRLELEKTVFYDKWRFQGSGQ